MQVKVQNHGRNKLKIVDSDTLHRYTTPSSGSLQDLQDDTVRPAKDIDAHMTVLNIARTYRNYI